MIETFHRDLKGGKEIELKHLKSIQKYYPDAYMIEGYCKEWDIFIPSKNFGIEIKSDKMSQKTGNIVVEIEFNGKLSALSTTKSKYWFFDTGLKTIIIEVEKLRNLVKKFKPAKFTARGDVREKKAYLIPQKSIEELQVPISAIKPMGALDSLL